MVTDPEKEVKCPFCGATGDPDWKTLGQLKAHLTGGECDELEEQF